MDLDRDIAILAEQERMLGFMRFDQNTAWELGTRLKAAADARGVAIAIEIRLSRETVFFHSMPGTTPANADWARRKRNTVELLQRSSYAVGRSLAKEGKTLEQKMGLALRDYATHGGGFPIRVDGVGCVGTVTVSGLPEREDHKLVVAVIAEVCGKSIESVQLD